MSQPVLFFHSSRMAGMVNPFFTMSSRISLALLLLAVELLRGFSELIRVVLMGAAGMKPGDLVGLGKLQLVEIVLERPSKVVGLLDVFLPSSSDAESLLDVAMSCGRSGSMSGVPP